MCRTLASISLFPNSHFNNRDICSVAQTSRRMHRLCSNSLLWHALCMRTPGVLRHRNSLRKSSLNRRQHSRATIDDSYWRTIFVLFHCRKKGTCPGCLKSCTSMSDMSKRDHDTLPICVFLKKKHIAPG